MSNFYTMDGGEMLGGWETSLAQIIAVDTGTKKVDDAKIKLLNKRYEEGKGYGLTGNSLYEYIAKHSGTPIMLNQDKVSTSVAKAFCLNIEREQKAEQKRIRDKLAEANRPKWPWYKYVVLGGGLVALVALSPTLNKIAGIIPSRKST